MQKKSNPQFNTPPKSQNISHGASFSSKQKPRHENRPNPFQIIQSQSSQSKQKYIERQNDGKQIEMEVEQRKVTQCISFDQGSQGIQQGRWRGIHSQSRNGMGPNQRSDMSEFSGINSRVVGQGQGPQTSQQTVKKAANLPPKPQLYQSRQHERSQKRYQRYTQPVNLSQKAESFLVKSQIGGSGLISNPQIITSQSFQSFKTPANHQPPIKEWSSPKQNNHHRIQELEELNDEISEMNEQEKIDMVKKSEKYAEQSIPKASWLDDVPKGEFSGITHYPQNQSNQYSQRNLFSDKDNRCFREEQQLSQSQQSEEKKDDIESLQNYQPHPNQTFITDYLSEESRQLLQQRRTKSLASFSLKNQLLSSQKSSRKQQVPKDRQEKPQNSQTLENESKSYKVIVKDSVQKNRDGRDSFYKNNDIYGLYDHTSSEKSQKVLNQPQRGDFQQNQSQQMQKQQQNKHQNIAESRENFSEVETSENVNISGAQRFSPSEYAAEGSEQFQIPTGDSRVVVKSVRFSEVHPQDEHEFQIPTGDIMSLLSHNSRNNPQSSEQEFQIPTGERRRVIVQSTEHTEEQVPLNVSNARTGRVTNQSMIQSNRLESPNQRLLEPINQTQSQRAPKKQVDREKLQAQTELRDRAENSERKFINEGIIRQSSIRYNQAQPSAHPVFLEDIVEPERINLPPIIVVSHEKKQKKQHLPIPTAAKLNRKRVPVKTLQKSKRKQDDRKVGQKLQDPVGSTYHFELVAERDRKRKALVQVRRSGRIYSKSKSKFEEELSAYDYFKEKQEGSVQQLQKESLEKEEQKIQEVPTNKKAKTSQSKSKKSKKSISKPKPNQSKKSRQSIQSFDDEPITVEWLREHVSELNEIIIDKAFFYDDYKAMTEKDAQISKFLLELEEKASNSPVRMKKAGQEQERENDSVVIKKDEEKRKEYIQEKGSLEIRDNYSGIQDNVFTKPIQISQKKSTMKREIERKQPQTVKSKKEILSRLEISRSKNKIQRTLELSVGKQSKCKEQIAQKAPQFEFAPYAQERPVHISDQNIQEKQEEHLTEEVKKEIFEREKKKYRVPDEFPLTIEAVMDPDILNLGIYALVRLGRLSEFQLGTRYAITPLCEIKYARKKHVLMVLKESKKLVPPEYSENIALVALNSMLVELIEKANCQGNHEGEIRMEKQQNKNKEKNPKQREKRNEDKMQVTNHFQDSTENLNEENTSQMKKRKEQDKKNETNKKELNEKKDQQRSRMRLFR